MPNQLAKNYVQTLSDHYVIMAMISLHSGHILQCKNTKGFDNKMFIYSRPVVMVIYLFSLSLQRDSTLLAKRTEI